MPNAFTYIFIRIILIINISSLVQAFDVNQTSNIITNFPENNSSLGVNRTNITTITVLPGESIQNAIQASLPGDIIEVHSGTYRENINITKNLVIRGEDNGNGLPVVDANGKGSAVEIWADGVRLENLMIANSSDNGAGIKVTSNHCIIMGNSVYNNQYGLILLDADNNTLFSNNISNNDNGISLTSSDNNTLVDNIAYVNKYGPGVELVSSNHNTLSGNNLSNNDGGIELASSQNNTLSDNNVIGNNFGIKLTSSVNNILLENIASQSKYGSGIELELSKNNILIGNVLIKGENGIHLDLSGNNRLSNNSMAKNRHDFLMDGRNISDFDNQIDADNMVNGRQIYYFRDARDELVNATSNAGMIICVNCNNFTMQDLNMSYGDSGILLVNTHDSLVSENKLRGLENGIQLYFSDNNTIRNNNLRDNNYGLHLISSENNTLFGNIALGCNHGISLESSSYNVLIGSNLSNNNNSIMLSKSANNTLSENNDQNSDYGIELELSQNNTITLCNLSNRMSGIKLELSQNNTISLCSLSNYTIGIELELSQNNEIIRCNLSKSTTGTGIHLATSANNILFSNSLSYSKSGINLEFSENNTIYGCNLSNNTEGIHLSFSTKNNLLANTVCDGGSGIYLDFSGDNWLSNNSMFRDDYNFQMKGNWLLDFDNKIDMTNLVDGMPIYYLKNKHNETIDSASNAGLVACFNCTNITVRRLNITNVGTGIGLYKTSYSLVELNNISDSEVGINIYQSDNNLIRFNTINCQDSGINIDQSDNNFVENNSFTNNTSLAIGYIFSGNNLFAYNTEKERNLTPSNLTKNKKTYYGIKKIFAGNFPREETKLDKGYEIRPFSSTEFLQKSMSSANYGETLDRQIVSIAPDDFGERANIKEEVYIPSSELKIGNNIELSKSNYYLPNPSMDDSTKKVTEKTNIHPKSMTQSHRSENDNDDRYKIAYKIEDTSHPVEEAANAEAEYKTAESAPAAEPMGNGKDSNVTIYYILKLMGLIAGGFIVIIATGYRGREPPMDDDDFDDIVSFKRNIENKRSGK